MKDIYYINDLEKLKALADPLRVDIITTLGTTKQNSQQLAKKLKINRTRIHYHLNILEEMGFIKVVDTDVVNGIMQKGDDITHTIDEENGICQLNITFAGNVKNLQVEINKN